MLVEIINILKASIKYVWVLVGMYTILEVKNKPVFPFASCGPLYTRDSSSIRVRLVMAMLFFSMVARYTGFPLSVL